MIGAAALVPMTAVFQRPVPTAALQGTAMISTDRLAPRLQNPECKSRIQRAEAAGKRALASE